MKADLTRDTFDPANHFSRVMMQQGRVTLDADWNEQASILLYTLRTMVSDIVGPFAGPANDLGFQTGSTGVGNLTFSPGRYYVDGIMVEIDEQCTYASQPYYIPPSTDAVLVELGLTTPTTNTYWLYLDVWEWHITYLSDAEIREVALNGPDTCTRTVVVWQIKGLPFTEGFNQVNNPDGGFIIANQQNCQQPITQLMTTSTGIMGARVDPGQTMDSPCITPPSATYRGTENQLYRVEIQTPGDASTATFKWSRDNGSTVTALISQSGNVLTVAQSRDFAADNWVELLDDNFELAILPGTLVKLAQAGNGTLTVDPSSLASGTTLDAIYAGLDQTANPRVRRWDQTDTVDEPLTNGAIPIVESTGTNITWIDLEDGVQVAFGKIQAENTPAAQYRTGDYWLIPARVATGDIEWPTSPNSEGVEMPDPMPPNGIEHHYAPLGFITWSGGTFQQSSCACTFNPIGMCPDGANAYHPGQRFLPYQPKEYQAREQADVQVVAAKRATSKAKPKP